MHIFQIHHCKVGCSYAGQKTPVACNHLVSAPTQTMCVTLYMIERLLVKSISVLLLNMYLYQSMAPVYAAVLLFMFIHTLINSANAVSAVFLISILYEATSQ